MSKKSVKILVWLIALTFYFNIGWGIGHYMHYNISTQTFESATWHAKIVAGHCALFAQDSKKAEFMKGKGSLPECVIASIVWPIIFMVSSVSWLIHGIGWALKLIFLGGLFKLFFGIS